MAAFLAGLALDLTGTAAEAFSTPHIDSIIITASTSDEDHVRAAIRSQEIMAMVREHLARISGGLDGRDSKILNQRIAELVAHYVADTQDGAPEYLPIKRLVDAIELLVPADKRESFDANSLRSEIWRNERRIYLEAYGMERPPDLPEEDRGPAPREGNDVRDRRRRRPRNSSEQ